MTDDKRRLGIKFWSEEDRPREKLLHKGPQALSSAELITILLRTGTPDNTALDIAKLLLQEVDNDLNKLNDQSISQLTKIKGIGKAKAITIIAAFELCRRRRAIATPKLKFTSSKAVYEYMYPYLADMKQENFYTLFLSKSNQIIEHVHISMGGISGTLVDPKVVFRDAVIKQVSAIILCHNHPSGNIKPSKSDMDITKKLIDGAKLLDISVLDHIIFSNEGYFSFADEGLI